MCTPFHKWLVSIVTFVVWLVLVPGATVVVGLRLINSYSKEKYDRYPFSTQEELCDTHTLRYIEKQIYYN